MVRVWIVYSQFPDDPSRIKGIYTEFENARAAYNNWDDKDKNLKEVELNEEYNPELILN